MTTLTVRGLDDDTRARLRVRAARNGRSMEAEVRAILHDAVSEPDGQTGLGSRIAGRFAAVGGIDLELPSRSELPRAAHFDA
jgi:antitoxin FitA